MIIVNYISMIKKLYFDINSRLITYDISSLLLKYYGLEKPIIICVGSDKVLADMVGVFVADILKNRGIDTIVFGGSRRNIDNNVCKYLSNHIDNSRILIVDSGLLMAENKVLLSPDFTCNDGSKISALSLIAGTIKMDNNKLLLANKSYNQIKKYVEIIADSICEYFSFVDLLCLDNK